MSCCVCTEKFDQSAHIPVIGCCGHSICENCLRIAQLTNCPLCLQENAFRSRKRNYQMLDMMKDMESSSQKRQKIQRFIEKHDLAEKTLLKCHECSGVVEESKSRICQPCATENGVIRMEPDGTVDLADISIPIEASVLCGSCFLEGVHEGHKSILMLPIKLRSESSISMCRARIKAGDAVLPFAVKLEKLFAPRDELLYPLRLLEASAAKAGIKAPLGDILEKSKREFALVRDYALYLQSELFSKMNTIQLECVETRRKEMLHAIDKESKSNRQSMGPASCQLEQVFPVVDRDYVALCFRAKKGKNTRAEEKPHVVNETIASPIQSDPVAQSSSDASS